MKKNLLVFLSICFSLCLSSCYDGKPSFVSTDSSVETDSSSIEPEESSASPSIDSESLNEQNGSLDESLEGSSLEEDYSKPAPMLSIIDDDGGKRFMKYLLPLVEKGIPISAAIITNWIGSGGKVMNWKDIEEIQEKGAEILSHSHTHQFAEECEKMKPEEIYQDYKLSRETLQSHGIDCDTIVYPGNSAFYQGCIDAARRVFSYGFRPGTDRTNYYRYIKPLEMDRWGVTTDVKYEYLASIIDALADEQSGYMVWMIHTSFDSFDQRTADVLERAINHAKERGVEMVTTKKGIQTYMANDETENA